MRHRLPHHPRHPRRLRRRTRSGLVAGALTISALVCAVGAACSGSKTAAGVASAGRSPASPASSPSASSASGDIADCNSLSGQWDLTSRQSISEVRAQITAVLDAMTRSDPLYYSLNQVSTVLTRMSQALSAPADMPGYYSLSGGVDVDLQAITAVCESDGVTFVVVPQLAPPR